MVVYADLDIASMLPATFTAPGMTEDEFVALCDKFPDATLEYTADGTVSIMPPTDPESSARVTQVVVDLSIWARQVGRGLVVGPDGGFRLLKGSRRSPDAAWFDDARWRSIKKVGVRFPTFAPEFVIEVRSPDDRLRNLRDKMQEYMDNSVLLGWLIDPFERTVEIYRQGQSPELLTNPTVVAGEGPVDGFLLSLERVFTA